MKNLSNYLMVLFGSAVLMAGCKKDEHTPNTADIQIAAPVDSHTYEYGDTVSVNATITAPEPMHGWELHLRKTADQSEVYTTDAHDHAATYNVTGYWVNNVTEHTPMELEVIATIDHDGNTASKKVYFHCHPQ